MWIKHLITIFRMRTNSSLCFLGAEPERTLVEQQTVSMFLFFQFFCIRQKRFSLLLCTKEFPRELSFVLEIPTQ